MNDKEILTNIQPPAENVSANGQCVPAMPTSLITRMEDVRPLDELGARVPAAPLVAVSNNPERGHTVPPPPRPPAPPATVTAPVPTPQPPDNNIHEADSN